MSTISINVQKVVHEWDDPDSDLLFILDEDGEPKEFEDYSNEERAALSAILEGEHKEMFEQIYQDELQDEIEAEEQETFEGYETVYVTSPMDQAAEQFLRVLTMWGVGFVGFFVIAFLVSLIFPE